MSELILASEIAKLADVNGETINRWVKSGVLPTPQRLGVTGYIRAWNRAEVLPIIKVKARELAKRRRRR